MKENVGKCFTIIAEKSPESASSMACLSVSQIRSTSLSAAVNDWVQKGDWTSLGLDVSDRRHFYGDEMFATAIVALEGLKNAWCYSTTINDELIVVSIFLNPSPVKSVNEEYQPNTLFTSYIDVEGGTFISQCEAVSLGSAISTFLHNGDVWWNELSDDQVELLKKNIDIGSISIVPQGGVGGVFSVKFEHNKPNIRMFCVATSSETMMSE
ncbi:hypothetical protein GCM10017044_28670 [Kordiimonas sediminis]|uniref:Uncharacterized protein n=1 Tax=Kordiimonas sediminis TaxID=1735581 RepID=A0A919AYI5_9PROT|nr:hypothetical protein [Kordiimonas sediminis]GHF31383.1 hypothetical protein GCM10017044_28670 [Kordiimonas sediminis]